MLRSLVFWVGVNSRVNCFFDILFMFENKQNSPEDKGPFNVVYNFRSVSTRSSKMSKKHRIRKLSDTPMVMGLKKNRKMTENIEV